MDSAEHSADTPASASPGQPQASAPAGRPPLRWGWDLGLFAVPLAFWTATLLGLWQYLLGRFVPPYQRLPIALEDVFTSTVCLMTLIVVACAFAILARLLYARLQGYRRGVAVRLAAAILCMAFFFSPFCCSPNCLIWSYYDGVMEWVEAHVDLGPIRAWADQLAVEPGEAVPRDEWPPEVRLHHPKAVRRSPDGDGVELLWKPAVDCTLVMTIPASEHSPVKVWKPSRLHGASDSVLQQLWE